MAKKKKTPKPSVSRGFATTSIPKKAVQAEEIAPPAEELPPTSDGLVTQTSADQATLRDSKKFDAEEDEQQFLQIMVDKYQEKTEKEISRAIKACFPTLPIIVP
ncbi:hypothetical protein HD554DRAFT_1375871 [Boletus coccyginus]|nr:hypothetical protein HD554DRAFT_1375871 [Boletus coccyginus]